MSPKTYDPYQALIGARWDDPRLQDLVRKIDELSLDRRSYTSPRKILIRQTLDHARASSVALLASDDGEGNLTVLSTFPLSPGETLVVEKQAEPPHGEKSKLCTVRDCRPGRRADAHEAAVFVSYLNCA